MWSSSGEDHNHHHHHSTTSKGLSSGGSSSSLTSSSPSPFSPLTNTNKTRSKTMEEVWKDINLSSLHDHNRTTTSTSFRGMIFQDFLARPFSKDPSNSAVSTRYGSPVPPPATMLTLNSDNVLRQNSMLQHQPFSQACSLNAPIDVFASPLGVNVHGKKRLPEKDSGDHRHKRMIKNRESAARSRARKQAYTNELEAEVAHLMEENAKLKKQLKQLSEAAAAQPPKKHTLQRTSTAPF